MVQWATCTPAHGHPGLGVSPCLPHEEAQGRCLQESGLKGRPWGGVALLGKGDENTELQVLGCAVSSNSTKSYRNREGTMAVAGGPNGSNE